jgi:beta-N-acetylhexosaminidase
VGGLRRHLLRGARRDRRRQEPLIVRDEPGVLLAVVGLAGGSVSSPEAPETAAVPAACMGEEPDDVRRRLGGRILVRMEAEATAELRRAARLGEIGGVILFPPPGTDPAALAGEIERLQAEAADAGRSPLLVAIDQEGGEVKRLPELPPDLSAPEIGGDIEVAESEGEATGVALAELGINIDLAPVLDVPAAPDSFITSRAFGTSPQRVAEAGTAFARGLEAGGVAATGKHFPGLGSSPVNTDEAPAEVGADDPVAALDELVPWEEAIAGGLDLVMLSNAVHNIFDSRLPAFAAEEAHALLRDDLGFEGVTITDDLGAAAVTARYDAPEAAVAAARGGTDVLLFALDSDPGVLDALVEAAERGRLDAGQIEASCVRIETLREAVAGETPR